MIGLLTLCGTDGRLGVDDAVADEGERADGIVAVAAAFKERVAVEIEKMALASGHPHLLVLTAAVDEAEEREELSPCAKTVLHRVRVTLGIGAQALEEAAH